MLGLFETLTLQTSSYLHRYDDALPVALPNLCCLFFSFSCLPCPPRTPPNTNEPPLKSSPLTLLISPLIPLLCIPWPLPPLPLLVVPPSCPLLGLWPSPCRFVLALLRALTLVALCPRACRGSRPGFCRNPCLGCASPHAHLVLSLTSPSCAPLTLPFALAIFQALCFARLRPCRPGLSL